MDEFDPLLLGPPPYASLPPKKSEQDITEMARRINNQLAQVLLTLGSVERRLAEIEAAMPAFRCDGVDEEGAHTLKVTCPVSCLEGVLSARPYHIIARAERVWTVADVVRGVRTRSLLSERNFGRGCLSEVTRVLEEAGLLP